MIRRMLGALVVATVGGVLAAPVAAQTANDDFVVSITVENNCTIDVTDLGFGTVSDLTATHDGATTGTVTCTGLSPVSISFDAGTGGASTFATRQMEEPGTETIDYNLYRDAARTEILGDGSGGTLTIDFTSTGGADVFDVFGQTVAGQNPKTPETYTSTITATVTF